MMIGLKKKSWTMSNSVLRSNFIFMPTICSHRHTHGRLFMETSARENRAS